MKKSFWFHEPDHIFGVICRGLCALTARNFANIVSQCLAKVSCSNDMGTCALILHVFFPHASPVYVEKTAFRRVMKAFLKTNLGCSKMFSLTLQQEPNEFCLKFWVYLLHLYNASGCMEICLPRVPGHRPLEKSSWLLTVEGGKDLRKWRNQTSLARFKTGNNPIHQQR